MFLAILLAAAFCTLISFFLLISRKVSDIDKIPGPKPWPIIGNALEFGNNTTEQLKNLTRLIKQYGPMVKVWIGSTLTIILSDVEKVEYILSSNVHINKSKGYRYFKPWLGDGLLLSNGDYWRKHRKMITPTFHFKLVEGFSEFINSNGEVLLQKLREKENEESLDIYPFIKLFALDVITESAMQTKVNAQQESNSDYVLAVSGFLNIHMRRLFSVIQQSDRLYAMTSDCKKQRKYIEVMKGFTENVIRLRRKERKADSRGKEDEFGVKRKTVFLDHLLDLQENEDLLTDQEIIDQVDTFMFTGHDTVSSAISFCLYELSKHPEIQEKLVQESNSVVGEDKAHKLSFREISEMKYLDMVFKESLRLYPTVPLIERELQTDVVFDGVNIPKGTVIQIIIFAILRNEEFYPEPEKFDPDRFLPENTKTRNPFAYIPFSAGPRNCIGMRYAQSLVKTTVIYILRNFKILPVVPEIKPILCNNAVIESENGLHVRIESR